MASAAAEGQVLMQAMHRKGEDDGTARRTVVEVQAGTIERASSSAGSIPDFLRNIKIPELGPKDVHPYHEPAKPSREAIKQSPHFPVLVTPNPMVAQQSYNGSAEPASQVPINGGPFAVESSIFQGVMEVHLRGLPTSHERLFRGKKRHFHIAVQGRFKRPVNAATLCMGQELLKDAPQVPPWVAEMVLTAVAKSFSSSTKVDVHAEVPHFMNPVLAACQLVNVSLPGAEPSLMEATENMTLWEQRMADKNGKPLAADKRRKWCDCASNLDGQVFTTEHVWTFHIWQHLIDFSQYRLSLGGWLSLDLAGPLLAQPLQLTTKDTETNEYIFSLLVWHEALLYGDDSQLTAQQAVFDKLQRLSSGVGRLWGRSRSTT